MISTKNILNIYRSDLCRLCAKFQGGSGFANALSKLCAKTGTTCPTECEKYYDLDHCKKCAAECR